MQCFLLFVALVFLVAAFSGAAVRAQVRASGRNRLYAQLAKRFGGTSVPGGWFGNPLVRFRYGESNVTLRVLPLTGYGVNLMQFQLSWPDPKLEFEVYPKGLRPVPGQMVHNPVSGLAGFEQRFAIQGSDPDDIRVFLSSAVQGQIERLMQYLPSRDFYVSVSRGVLTVRKAASINNYATLENLSQLVIELYEQAMLTRSNGIEFVQSDSLQVLNAGKCQVCGEEISQEMVICRRCKTPHHYDCWHYYGACSTYGCQETAYIRPLVAKTIAITPVTEQSPKEDVS